MSYITPYDPKTDFQTRVELPVVESAGRDVARVWNAVRRRWRVCLAIAAGFILLVGIGTFFAPKSYTTTVRLMAGRPSSDMSSRDRDTALPILNALVLANGEQSAETTAQLAQQRDIAQKVVDKLRLPTTPAGLLGSVSVKPVVNTAMLNLSVTWKTPERSAEITNAFADAFVQQEREYVRSEAVAALSFLSGELPRARLRMQSAAAALARYQSTHGFIDANAHAQDVAGRLASIDQRIEQLRADLGEATAALANVTQQLGSTGSTIRGSEAVGPNPVAAQLRAKLADLDTQIAAALRSYTPQHPTVIALRQQRAALAAQLNGRPSTSVSQEVNAPNPLYQSLQQQVSSYRARIQGDRGQIATLQQERRGYGPDVRKLPIQAMQFATLQEDAKRAASVYSALAQKYNDALIAKTTSISDITIVQRASADSFVRRPSLAINLAVATIAGLLLAIAVALILELVEERASEEALPRILGLPVIARIPSFDTTNPRMLPYVQSMTIEAFLHLCVALSLNVKHPLKTLAVLSPCRGDGKSTVAFKLATGMATLRSRVLLVDADMRRPTLHEKADCPNLTGLSDVLEGTVPLRSAVQRVAPNLDLLSSGHGLSNPVALLQSQLEAILDTASAQYSMVILDAPALAAVSDGLLIARYVDGSLLVVIEDVTDEREARTTVGQLKSLGIDNLLGIVANRDTRRHNTSYADYFDRKAGGTAIMGEET